jgi:hypothetical protein
MHSTPKAKQDKMRESESRILQLSGSMHLDTTIARLKQAARDPTVNRISCLNLDLALVYSPLLELLSTRHHWESIALVDCQRMEIILSKPQELSRNETCPIRRVNFLAISCSGELDRKVAEAFVANGVIDSSMTQLKLNTILACESMELLARGLAASTRLNYLNLSSCAWSSDDGSVEALCHGLRQNTSLARINLNQCYLRDKQVAELVDAVAGHPHLKELDLRGNQCQTQTLRALEPLLLSQQLQSLKICNLESSQVGVTGLKDFFSSLRGSFLKRLCLEEYKIEDDDMGALVDSLAHTSVIDLSLQDCEMTSLGLRLFARSLNKCSLQSLAISGGEASSSPDLLQGLQHNTTLQRLSIPNKTPMHEYYLNLNRGGRRLLREPNLPTDLWITVLVKAQTTTTYYGGPDRSADVFMYLLRNRILLER